MCKTYTLKYKALLTECKEDLKKGRAVWYSWVGAVSSELINKHHFDENPGRLQNIVERTKRRYK